MHCIKVELTHGISHSKHVGTDGTLASPEQSSSAIFGDISAVEQANLVHLQPSESKFTLINASMLLSGGVALAAEITAYGRSLDGDLEANSSTVSLDVFIGYKQVADRLHHDLFVTFPLTWNTTSRQYELFRYLFLPLQYVANYSRLNISSISTIAYTLQLGSVE